MAYERISVDSNVMGGAPCIRGTRIPVVTVLRYVGAGTTPEELLDDFPQLTNDDLREVFAYVIETVRRGARPITG